MFSPLFTGESPSAPDASKQAPPPSSSSLPSDPVPEDGAAATASGFGSSGPVALLSKDACHIFVGGKGLLWVLETGSLKILDVVKVSPVLSRVERWEACRTPDTGVQPFSACKLSNSCLGPALHRHSPQVLLFRLLIAAWQKQRWFRDMKRCAPGRV